MSRGRVLIIAGSDPSGGAGLQADIKTVTALGGYAAAVVTALTVQNTTGVRAVQPVDPSFICDQIEAVIGDIGADAVKIGMIGAIDAAHAIADVLAPVAKKIPIVIDPVLIATSGDSLAESGMAEAVMTRLAPLAAIMTPNTDEASALSGLSIMAPSHSEAAGQALLAAGAGAALIKGAHLEGEAITDTLVTAVSVAHFTNQRIGSRPLHGTGCTLASAIATHLARGVSMEKSVQYAIDYVRSAIASAAGLGAGAAPLNHSFAVQNAEKD